jgi:hypothetical protein
VDLLDHEPGGAEQGCGAVGVVAPAQRVPGPRAARRVGGQRGGDVQVPVHRPAEHRGGPAGDQHARGAARAQRGGQRGHHRRRIVDHLQHGVAEHQVRAAGLDQPGERVAVALHGTDPLGDPGLRGAAGQRGERVGTGVDHGDPMPGLGERHGETAGAAADVEHGQRGVAAAFQLGAQHRPDHGGTGGQRRPGEPAWGLLHPVEPSHPVQPRRGPPGAAVRTRRWRRPPRPATAGRWPPGPR